MKNRSKGEIVSKILKIAKEGSTWTNMEKKAGLSGTQGKEYITPLIEKEYLVGLNGEIGRKYGRKYHPSQKGLDLSENLENVKTSFRELGLATE